MSHAEQTNDARKEARREAAHAHNLEDGPETVDGR